VLVALGLKLFGASNLVAGVSTLLALSVLSAKYVWQRNLMAPLADPQESQY
jgi:hypothetical protein